METMETQLPEQVNEILRYVADMGCTDGPNGLPCGGCYHCDARTILYGESLQDLARQEVEAHRVSYGNDSSGDTRRTAMLNAAGKMLESFGHIEPIEVGDLFGGGDVFTYRLQSRSPGGFDREQLNEIRMKLNSYRINFRVAEIPDSDSVVIGLVEV